MEFIGIIPARYGSSRFPGKPLCDINGMPMIYHVYNSASKWNNWKKLYVATDDERIGNVCKNLNIPYLMTSDNHNDCMDRCAEAGKILKNDGITADRYIIIQGDEPLFNVKSLDSTDYSSKIIGFYTDYKNNQDVYDTNCVKVVLSKKSKAIYFSRYAIPFHDEKTKKDKQLDVKFFKQLGIYSFGYDELQLYSDINNSDLENTEGVGLLRFLENDIEVDMSYTSYDSISVDTEEDRVKIIKILDANDR